LVAELPWSLEKLKKVKGFGKKKTETFGEEILEIINDYRAEQGLEVPLQAEIVEKPKRETKPPREKTQKVTFDLYKSGKTVEEIAALRGYTSNTIEGHLADYVASGELDISLFVQPDKIKLITAFFETRTNFALSPAKEALGDTISWGELKIVAKYLESKQLNFSE
jgi:uncharacterized protein YpbB